MPNYNSFINMAKKGNLEYHTFSLPEQKSLTMVLKGLEDTTSPEILDELKSKGLNPINCYCLQKNKPTLHPAYKISFPPGTNIHDVRKIGHIFHSRIYWEKYNSQKSYIQCYRCQAFGHLAKNCNKSPNCLKCSANHPTKDCIKTPDTPATCYNCKGDHPANYTGCPSLLKYLAKKDRTPDRPPATQPTLPPPPPHQPPKLLRIPQPS